MSYPQETFRQTELHSGSITSRYRNAVLENTLLYQLNVLKKTGRYDAFQLKWHSSYSDKPNVWPVPNHLFWESDIAKWIESACYFLQQKHNDELRAAVDELAEMICTAQHSDGYINIHFSVVEPGKRFTNIRDLHELYNAGHLIEAALAHNQLCDNSKLLGPLMKYADLLCTLFGPGAAQMHGYPGHPEVELALLRLYGRTKHQRYRELATYFINERGNPRGVFGRHFYHVEAERRGEHPNARPVYHPEPDALWYYQAHKPIAEQETIEGHSVRAMYLLTAAADLIRLGDCEPLTTAVDRLWTNMTERKMYITGGIGAMPSFEGFGIDYFLPQGTDEGGCYAETCAAIGVMMLAQRLLQLKLDGKYADVMELCYYNAVLTGMSSDGIRFTYDNQLASCNQSLSQRQEWFTCACCPPNVSRLLGSIGGYLWDSSIENEAILTINVHMFAPATFSTTVGGSTCSLTLKTDWPWQGEIQFELRALDVPTNLNVRIPGWVDSWDISPSPPKKDVRNGYLHIPTDWLQANPRFRLSLPISSRFISPHPFTNQNTITIARGPIIYCAEDVDNPWVTDHFKSLMIDPDHCKVSEKRLHDEQTGEAYIEISVEQRLASCDLAAAVGFFGSEKLARATKPANTQALRLVPYYFRANRAGRGQMRVGFRHWTSTQTAAPIAL